jgi:hypothetical protein
VVAGLRYETGGDWDVYGQFLEKVTPICEFVSSGKTGSSRHFEFGYFLLCSIFKQLGLGIQVLFFVIALFDITLIAKALKHYTKYVVTGLFVYYSLLYLTLEFSLIRQAIAASICFYAFKYVPEKKMFKYFLLIFLAFLFHMSALIMLPLYFFFKVRFSSIFLIIVVCLGCLIMLFQITWINRALLFVVGLLGEDSLRKVVIYTTNKVYNVNRGIGIGFFLNLFLFILFLWKRKRFEEKAYGNLFLNVFMVNIIVYYYMYEFIEISVRFRLYYMLSLVVLFPHLLETCPKLINRMVLSIVLVLYCLTTNRKIYMNDPSTIVLNPYQNYVIHKCLDKKSMGKIRLIKNEEFVKKERKKEKKNE